MNVLFGITPEDREWRAAVEIAYRHCNRPIVQPPEQRLDNPSVTFLHGLIEAGLCVCVVRQNYAAWEEWERRFRKPEYYFTHPVIPTYYCVYFTGDPTKTKDLGLLETGPSNHITRLDISMALPIEVTQSKDS